VKILAENREEKNKVNWRLKKRKEESQVSSRQQAVN
jgi:hypothetical protein